MKQDIVTAGKITENIRTQYFFDWNFERIRNWLEENGLDRHLEIELTSVEVVLATPSGILMQIRSSDNNQLGLWGGVVNDSECSVQAAIREVQEETGIIINESRLKFIEIDLHNHTYANGDKATFKTYRYLVSFDTTLEVQLNDESSGFVIVNLNNIDNYKILDHQVEFIKKILQK